MEVTVGEGCTGQQWRAGAGAGAAATTPAAAEMAAAGREGGVDGLVNSAALRRQMTVSSP